MPELPEVETVRRSLLSLIGKRVARARLIRADICTPVDAGARGLLEGGTIVELVRRGKRLSLIVSDGRAMTVHLGMTGQLRLTSAAPPEDRHVHAVWWIEGAGTMYFRDPRRFGGLWTFEHRRALNEHLAELGPDALGIRAAELRRELGGSRRAIKAALLDQGTLAGVGNIYADEALFRSRIRPTRRCERINATEWTRLAAAIRRTLAGAVSAGGSTVRDYADASGRAGRAQQRHAVYGRAGEPCRQCGTILKGIRLAQRATVYCGHCQR